MTLNADDWFRALSRSSPVVEAPDTGDSAGDTPVLAKVSWTERIHGRSTIPRMLPLRALDRVRLRGAALCMVGLLSVVSCACSPAASKALTLCRGAFGIATRSAAPGTVGQLRALRPSAARHAFPSLATDAFVAWCIDWRRAGGRFSSDVVSSNGMIFHVGIVSVADGKRPTAGPGATK
jgi:hypothetical protein